MNNNKFKHLYLFRIGIRDQDTMLLNRNDLIREAKYQKEHGVIYYRKHVERVYWYGIDVAVTK